MPNRYIQSHETRVRACRWSDRAAVLIAGWIRPDAPARVQQAAHREACDQIADADHVSCDLVMASLRELRRGR